MSEDLIFGMKRRKDLNSQTSTVRSHETLGRLTLDSPSRPSSHESDHKETSPSEVRVGLHVDHES